MFPSIPACPYSAVIWSDFKSLFQVRFITIRVRYIRVKASSLYFLYILARVKNQNKERDNPISKLTKQNVLRLAREDVLDFLERKTCEYKRWNFKKLVRSGFPEFHCVMFFMGFALFTAGQCLQSNWVYLPQFIHYIHSWESEFLSILNMHNCYLLMCCFI